MESGDQFGIRWVSREAAQEGSVIKLVCSWTSILGNRWLIIERVSGTLGRRACCRGGVGRWGGGLMFSGQIFDTRVINWSTILPIGFGVVSLGRRAYCIRGIRGRGGGLMFSGQAMSLY